MLRCYTDCLGDYVIMNFTSVFLQLDEDLEHKLSKGKTRRDKKKWAIEDFWLQLVANNGHW